jgi:hypothetical protein
MIIIAGKECSFSSLGWIYSASELRERWRDQNRTRSPRVEGRFARTRSITYSASRNYGVAENFENLMDMIDATPIWSKLLIPLEAGLH